MSDGNNSGGDIGCAILIGLFILCATAYEIAKLFAP
jgi:hypothetical protein